MKMKKRKAPVVASLYPSACEVKKVARFAFQSRSSSSADARGLTLEDVEQEIHLKICEVLYADRGRPLKVVYTAMWNRARNIRRDGRRSAQHLSDQPVEDLDLLAPDETERLENRSCLRRLDARLSTVHKDTLQRSVAATTGETIAELGLSYEGWRKRLITARRAAASELS